MTSPRTIAGLAMLAVAISPASHIVYADSGPYTVQDAGPANAVARGVNATAMVAGTSADQAFRTAFGAGPEILPGLSTPDFAFGVHDEGWVVGSSGFQPVKFAPAAVALDPTPFFGEATAVNAAGDIAGYGFFSGVRAFVWLASGGGQEMPIAATSMAAAINDRRVVTGQVVTGVGQGAAFRWTVGEAASALPTLGGASAKGRGINNAGDIVGDSYRTSQGNDVAAWWKAGGEVVDLGTLGGAKSSAADINNHGQIVGYAETASGARRAFLYENGVLVDLNTLLEPGSGWVLVSANAVNDAGQIAGEGLFGDDPEPRAFLLTPVEATDTTPPVISAVRTTPSSIWPPRHQMVDVRVEVDASDDSGETPVCSITGVTSSEPENGSGDGDTAGDSEIVGALAARVRAERSGPVGSRVYALAVECVDGSGNAASGTGIVVVGELSTAKTARAKR
jgi:probable HAF family extracellular repeat protein